MIGYNRIKNYIEDNEFHFDIFIDHIYIANYEKILSLSDTRVSFVAQNKKITLTGNKLSLIKMLDDELLITFNYFKDTFHKKERDKRLFNFRNRRRVLSKDKKTSTYL